MPVGYLLALKTLHFLQKLCMSHMRRTVGAAEHTAEVVGRL